MLIKWFGEGHDFNRAASIETQPASAAGVFFILHQFLWDWFWIASGLSRARAPATHDPATGWRLGGCCDWERSRCRLDQQPTATHGGRFPSLPFLPPHIRPAY
jgi:hypothetical protein